MNCKELAERIERLQPEASPRDVARVCLLLANQFGNTDDLIDDEHLAVAWQEVGLKLQAATDQHAAMAEELDALARTNPKQFGVEQIWTLIRAIKVQSQVLQLYVGRSIDI